MIDLTLRCPVCGRRADMCFEHGDDWKKRPDDPTIAQLLAKATLAELDERVATFCDEAEDADVEARAALLDSPDIISGA